MGPEADVGGNTCLQIRQQRRAGLTLACAPPALTWAPSRAPPPQLASTNTSTASFASQPDWRRCAAAAVPSAAASAAAAGRRAWSGSSSTKPSEPSPRGERATVCHVLHSAAAVLLLLPALLV